jgi:SAM-dependent methyltransferase
MATQTFDALKYKAGQRQDWSTASAGWKKWWMIIEQGVTPVTQRMVELAQIRAGQRVLDVATGIGEPALTAARLVGPSGHVTATDIAPGMLEIATERAKQAGLSNIEFREMDAETIDFPEGSFDAVLCRFGLMFLPNLAASLQAIRRVVADGGHVAAAVWGPPDRHFGSVAMGAVARELKLPPSPPGTPNIFSLADRTALERSLTQAGFTNVRTEPLNVSLEFESVDVYIRMLQDTSPPIWNLLANQSEERKAEVWRAVAEANRPFAAADGALHLEAESVLVAARKPGA